LHIKGIAILCDTAVGHVHIAELDRNAAIGIEHPFATGVRFPAYQAVNNDNGSLKLPKYLSRPLPITNMNGA
jgi:hypothetical protein